MARGADDAQRGGLGAVVARGADDAQRGGLGCLRIAVVDAPAAIAVGGRVLARVRLPATAG